MGVSDPLWDLTMSFGDMCPMEPSLVGAEGSDKVSESGYKVSSLVGFSLGGLGSGVGSLEGGSLGDSQGFSSLLLKSSG